jgi:hypothetical protein
MEEIEEIRQHLQALGLKSCATQDQAKQAYRDLMMVWHPDRFPANSRLQQLAQEKTKEFNTAYQTLKSRLPINELRTDHAKRASSNAGETQQQNTPGRPPNFGSQQERSRQIASPNTATKQTQQNRPNCYWMSTTTGVLILVFSCLSCCAFLFVVYDGFSPWKALAIELLVGISFYSLVEARSAHPQLTFWNYLRTFATTTLFVCVGIALLAAWLLRNADDRRSNT